MQGVGRDVHRRGGGGAVCEGVRPQGERGEGAGLNSWDRRGWGGGGGATDPARAGLWEDVIVIYLLTLRSSYL